MKKKAPQEKFKLAKELSRQTVLTESQAFDILTFFDFDIDKSLKMCEISAQKNTNTWHYFTMIRAIKRTEERHKPKPLTWKQRIKSLTNRK